MSSRQRCFLFFLLFFAASAYPQAANSRRAEIARHTRLAQQYLQEQKPDLALPEFQALAALEPDNADVRGNLGVLLYFHGDYAAAVPQLRASVRLRPGLYKIQALLGLAEERTGDESAAVNDLRAAFPGLQDANIKQQVGNALISQYSRTGDLQDAVAVTGAMLKDDPTNVNLLYTQYRLASDISDQTILTLALVAPHSAQMHQLMAHELYRHDDTTAALANFRRAIQIDPALPGVHFELAEFLYNSSDPTLQAQAEGEYKLALAEDPSNATAETRLGDIAAQRGDTTEAQARYARALQLNPNDDDAMVDDAKLLLATGQQPQAEQLLKKAIEIDPTDYIAHYRLSTVYRQQGNVDAAKQEMTEYQKYKAMKEKLRKIFDQMRLATSKLPADRDTSGMGDAKK